MCVEIPRLIILIGCIFMTLTKLKPFFTKTISVILYLVEFELIVQLIQCTQPIVMISQ